MAKSPLFADLAIHPLVLAFAEAELGPRCLLSALLAINLHPGETVQPWHFLTTAPPRCPGRARRLEPARGTAEGRVLGGRPRRDLPVQSNSSKSGIERNTTCKMPRSFSSISPPPSDQAAERGLEHRSRAVRYARSTIRLDRTRRLFSASAGHRSDIRNFCRISISPCEGVANAEIDSSFGDDRD